MLTAFIMPLLIIGAIQTPSYAPQPNSLQSCLAQTNLLHRLTQASEHAILISNSSREAPGPYHGPDPHDEIHGGPSYSPDPYNYSTGNGSDPYGGKYGNGSDPYGGKFPGAPYPKDPYGGN